jgi:hypothetical protein
VQIVIADHGTELKTHGVETKVTSVICLDTARCHDNPSAITTTVCDYNSLAFTWFCTQITLLTSLHLYRSRERWAFAAVYFTVVG